ncbi:MULTISPECIES: cryptochrome/photolyase family protein [Nostoc]|uniref:Cryptochrome/photolyase family protein n=1 Tax=Nostoc paludosum FACHB-159 TaxID=2692908 RepID=A0ABR8KM52_9NOSO|nr:MULTISPECIES: cryptochrome/photolyase family protein [Nostoc]MBD2683342.1 cryptochrome/photolyase family protein [Nostoc sp. FACHB-857]MBD2739659.1 cryptochrome/photolyase family protein [Nostoc paludosum FACHB-159]
MTIGVWVLGDQLWAGQSALQSCVHLYQQTPVILIESLSHALQRPYHLQKLVLVWSAMRHFADELRCVGWPVTYTQASDFHTPLLEWIKQYKITELRVMTPTDRPFFELIQNLNLTIQVTFTPNNRFIWSDEDFRQWAAGRKRLIMEDFYRQGRQRFNILMEGNQPVGGRWNFDRENRKPPKGKLTLPQALWFEPDSITQDVINFVKHSQAFKDSQAYWKLEPFRWGVTRQQALQVLKFFLETRLSSFGPYQDAMVTGEQTMWHAMLSPYLNLGLLHPLEVVRGAEQAYLDNRCNWELNSIEGFIRQVLGWREYMHGVYIYLQQDYSSSNWFNHTHPLPAFYWTGDTKMNCLHQILTQVKQIGYAHHIQRLMVLNNFALIAGISPQELEDWFHAAFIDGYDWVMQTNVIGMGQFADAGMIASKPYAASANYINNMSDYCKNCTYKHRQRSTDDACPFNFFYWDFLARNYDKLKHQPRMTQILRNLERISPEELQNIRSLADNWHSSHTVTDYSLTTPSTHH